jgi:type II secretory pathway pseudopilin PulG
MKKGFTLIEILVISSIIVAFSLISIPLFVNYQKTTKLKNEARLMATNIRFAQQLAITEQNRHEISFNELQNSYMVVNANTQEIIKTINLNPEVEIISIENLTNNKAVFIPSGGVIEAGEITLSNSKGKLTTVNVKPSGYVQITE